MGSKKKMAHKNDANKLGGALYKLCLCPTKFGCLFVDLEVKSMQKNVYKVVVLGVYTAELALNAKRG
jgi:hypothetical protein